MRPQPKIDHHCKDSQGCDFCTIYQIRSPDGARRNPGLPRSVDAAPDFAALHPGYARSQIYDNDDQPVEMKIDLDKEATAGATGMPWAQDK
jgi:hypothetical protein